MKKKTKKIIEMTSENLNNSYYFIYFLKISSRKSPNKDYVGYRCWCFHSLKQLLHGHSRERVAMALLPALQ